MKDSVLYVRQILEAIGKIQSFVGTTARETFEKDAMMQSAVILQLMLIGEVAKRVSEATKAAIDVPWKDIVGFRDIAIHDYFNIDLDIVWNTVTGDLPPMREKIAAFLTTHDAMPSGA